MYHFATVLSTLLASSLPASLAAPGTPSSPSAQNTAPFTPAGGIGTAANATPPVYHPLSDFDFQSMNLALNQEWIELDLFHHALAQFSVEEFEAAGINADDRFLIEFMADQEVGHATMLTNILGPTAAKPCNYTYPFTTVRGFVDFCQKLTRFGESGVYGFLEHLDSRPSAELLLQSITTEARQQMIFRQFEGLFPMPIWFTPGITQSMAWTLLSPYIAHCPAENPHIVFQNFPALNITNNPSAIPLINSSLENSTLPAITHNRSIPLSKPGFQLDLTWEKPGKITGYDGLYTTNTSAGPAQFVAWISQLNTTYTPLFNISADGTSGSTLQPGDLIFGNGSAPLINGTLFIAITDNNTFVTPFNMSLLNTHIVAGPAMYQSG
ncbi:Rds1 protein [Roridomyces roridus]|uniref:Rds1 protein n=1 Tax=Roridomyces roridus TaxID=1738132 RepID=A0AAD7CFQ6_9AGAR|nr:Rds1 protein [Roridomyces roridus]